MNNFTYHNPTKIIFGEGTIPQISKEIPDDARVLITFGGGSIKKNGVHTQVMKALENHTVFEFGGIEANPQYSTLMKAVELCRNENITYLLAVGGGSVLDGTKFIAAAVPFVGEPWDILSKYAKVESALPLASVLTLPATGSEANAFAVVSRKEIGKKLAFGAPPLTFPKFSVLDPLVTQSLSARQRANGVVDAFVHVTEQYLTFPQNSPLQDRYAEAILKTLIEEGPEYVENPDNTDAAKNVMWAATLALNGLISAGLVSDWATHSIGHELTALHNIDHARTLAIVWPGMMRKMKDEKRAKLLQYGSRVWNIERNKEEAILDLAISKTEMFFNNLGVSTRLSDYKLDESVIKKVTDNLRKNNFVSLGEKKQVTPEKVEMILQDRL